MGQTIPTRNNEKRKTSNKAKETLPMPIKNLKERKLEHLRIPLKEDVEAKHASTYFEYVHLVHNALPELDLSEINSSTTFLSHSFSAPILIDALTGGIPEAEELNITLAKAAEQFKIGMVLGSQRAGLESQEVAETYAVARRYAPTAFLAANVGGAELAKGLSLSDAERLVEMIKADALVVHLNPLQELIQIEGEPRYKGVLQSISRLTSHLKVPVIVKEVGSGVSREVAMKLELAGVAAVNVAGVGGTSWAGVEQMRAEAGADEAKAKLGLLFWDWGIPTAASLIEVRRAVKIPVIASGGIRDGLTAAKAIALGAGLCGMALPMLRHAAESFLDLSKFIEQALLELKSAMYLVGAANIDELRKVRYVLSGPLAEWVKSLE